MEHRTSLQLGDRVEHRYFGKGCIDQVFESDHGTRYHVRFDKISAWCPSGDLRPIPEKANDRG